MGRKVHPVGFRLGIVRKHEARWYAEGKEYAKLLGEDRQIRKLIEEDGNNQRAGVAQIEIERIPAARQVSIRVHTAKPGILIGRKGQNITVLRHKLESLTGKKVHLDILEVSNPDIDAKLIGESIASQLERRVSHKRAMKQAVRRAMRSGAKGVMITAAGRLGGSDMARRESVREGRIPRHTLRADIDYKLVEALTTYSKIGIKVWVYKGDIFPETKETISGAYSSG